MLVYKSNNFSSLYKESLTDLFNNPQYITSPRGFDIKENTNVCLVLENPLSCLFKSKVRSSQKKYIAAELLWYFSGNNNISFIKKYSSFWEKIADSSGNVNSAYGHLILNYEKGDSQYLWAIRSLIKDKDSRQAILHFNTPQHQYQENKDFPCTLYGIFHIRNNKLNFTVHMRSNDVVFGLPNDVVFFATLQCQALNHLKKYYPELQLGSYTHIADSYHLYSHHFEVIQKLINSDLEPDFIPILDENFITENGITTINFLNFFDDFENYSGDSNTFNWIKNHITK